jgi:hypothetical protein
MGYSFFNFGGCGWGAFGCIFIKRIYSFPIAAWDEMTIDVNSHLDA